MKGPTISHPIRKIIHIDMDCFYAAVEMRERPDLKGHPIAVGGGGHREVVTTCNYEARRFGVHSSMPGFMARERCPHLVFLTPCFDLYRAASQQIRQIFHEFTPLVETLSLDEAYLDVTAFSKDGRYAWDIAKEIRARILKETLLTSSAGIAPNKMLAKIASDWRKPNGQFAILPEQIPGFMTSLPVRKVWGVGPRSAERFAQRGIHTCGDLQTMTRMKMAIEFGKWGEELYHLCRGVDERKVHPHRVSKSLSNESTFSENLASLGECKDAITKLSGELLDELRMKAPTRKIRKAFVKIKFSDFTLTTRECLCNVPSVDIYQTLLTEAHGRKQLPIRLLGTGVRFDHGTIEEADEIVQPELFENSQ